MNKCFTDIIFEGEGYSPLVGNSTNKERETIQITPAMITKKSIRYCRELTSTSRQWMEQNPNGALIHDYVKFPGKLDHTTCVSVQVSNSS